MPRFTARGKELLYRALLTDLARSPDPNRFLRIHRSVIVNIESICNSSRCLMGSSSFY
jgi:DNA-binding LytR/AlgR family response regulator